MLSKRMADGVGFSFIVEKLECFSYYGDEKIREIKAAFLDSVTLQNFQNSINLTSCHQNISLLMELFPHQVAEIQDLLSNFKNIRGTIKKLEHSCLSQVEFFEIKRFLLGLEKLIDFWDKTKIDLVEIRFTKMTDALNILDSKKQRIAVFSVYDDDFPALRAVRHKKAQIEAAIDKQGMTDELIKKRAEIVKEEDKLEQIALNNLTDKLRPFMPNFLANMENIGMLDFALAKTVLAKQTGATRPKISPGTMRLVNMWNPKTQTEHEKKGKAFTKTSIELEPGATVLIGANMGGKSLTIKTVLLNVLLANMGFFVYAIMAEIPLFDDIFFIEEGMGNDFLSSFGAEIMQINEVVKSLLGNKLFIALDEPARTTNPAEGTKIVRGIVSFLARHESTSVISTHYDNVQENAQAVYQTASFSHDGIRSANTENLANYIKFELRKVSKGAAIPTEAIRLCKIFGMNPALLAEID